MRVLTEEPMITFLNKLDNDSDLQPHDPIVDEYEDEDDEEEYVDTRPEHVRQYHTLIREAIIEQTSQQPNFDVFVPSSCDELFTPPIEYLHKVVNDGYIKKALENAYRLGYARGHRIGALDMRKWTQEWSLLPFDAELEIPNNILESLIRDNPDWFDQHKPDNAH